MTSNILSIQTVSDSSSGGLIVFSKIKASILKAKIDLSKFRQVKKKHRKFLSEKLSKTNINICLKALCIFSLVIVILSKYFLTFIGQKS